MSHISNQQKVNMQSIVPIVFSVVLLVFAANTSIAASNQQMIEEAKQAVKERLIDPESARFRNIRVSVVNTVWIKGKYNAKNSFGEYADFEKFIYIPEEKVVVFESKMRRKADEEPLEPSGEMGSWKLIYFYYFVKDW